MTHNTMPGEPSASLRLDMDVGADADAEELDQLVMELRSALLETDVDSVDRAAAGEPPSGAKSPTAYSVSSLVVTLSNSAVIVAMLGVIKSWAARGRNRRVKITIGTNSITVDGASKEDHSRLITSWIEQSTGDKSLPR